MKKRTRIILFVALFCAVVLVVAGLIFRPWLAFIDVRVNETLPTTVNTVIPQSSGAPSVAPAVPVQVAYGSFISHEHSTSGLVRIVEQPDGTRLLAIENLETTNGPDVHVWLSAADVVDDRSGWSRAGSAAFVDLGLIKGNQGNQVYQIPAEVDLTQIRSVSLWCVQFSVSFGAAQLNK